MPGTRPRSVDQSDVAKHTHRKLVDVASDVIETAEPKLPHAHRPTPDERVILYRGDRLWVALQVFWSSSDQLRAIRSIADAYSAQATASSEPARAAEEMAEVIGAEFHWPIADTTGESRATTRDDHRLALRMRGSTWQVQADTDGGGQRTSKWFPGLAGDYASLLHFCLLTGDCGFIGVSGPTR